MTRLFLDFDETIFDSASMLKWLDIVMQNRYGLEPGLFAGTINNYHVHASEGHRLYKHREHFGITKIPWQTISTDISKLVEEQNQDFCYPEVHKVIKRLAKDYKDLGILTFGDSEYQNYKISHCRVLGGLKIPVRVVSEPKRAYLAREYAGQKGVLVDDKHPLNLPNGWTHIWINRKLVLKAPKKLDKAIWQINSLEQLTDLPHKI